MSGITSGIGLVSGIDIASIVDQLIAIDSRPVRQLEGRVQVIDAQRTAYLSISAQLLALKNSALNMDKLSFFRRFSSKSSNESAMIARASESAAAGSYSFRVRSLVSNNAVISRGFADSNATPVGVGTLSIEVGQGRVNPSTLLGTLNGGQGVRRGVITITDRDDQSADIDLSHTLTVDDILTAINSNSDISVRARVTSVASNGATGDRIVIEDVSGNTGTVGRLIVANKVGSFTATDLGIAGDSATGRVDGRDLVRLVDTTPLDLLNDGNGVGRLRAGTDLVFETANGNFNVSLSGILASQPDTDLRALNSGNGVRLGTIRITDRAGNSVDVDLADDTDGPVRTPRDVRQRITDAAAQAGVSISLTIVNSHLQITDTSDAPEETAGNLTIEDLTVDGVAGYAAADLGIAQSVEENQIIGRDIYRVSTVGDVLRAINYAPDNTGFVEARIAEGGNGIVLEAHGFGDSVTVRAGDGSTAAADLGLLDAGFSTAFETRDLIAGLNTVLLTSLDGGRGIAPGSISFTGRDGTTTGPIDFDAASTLQDVVDLINENAATSIVASINSAGSGIALRDDSGGLGPLIATDQNGGTMAAALGIAGSHDAAGGEIVNGGNLQRQYIARQSRLSDLNGGRGVESGTFRVTDSAGLTFSVIVAGNAETIGEVIDAFNTAPGKPDTMEARINDTGDGIIVIDSSAGDGALKIEDVEGRPAAGLRLAGTASSGSRSIDGSFEIRIDVSAGDTLDTLVEKINAASGGVSAAVVNDGGSVNPYSLTLTSTVSGRAGELMIDTGGLDFGFGTLTQASDAVITVGGQGTSNPLLITSSSNTIENVIDGVTLDLLAPSDEEVSIVITQDVDAIVEAVTEFVTRYNDVQKSMDDATRFDQETLERAPLQGDRTVSQIRSRMHGMITRRVESAGDSFSRMFTVGLRVGAGNRLEFDEDKFREAYAESPAALEALFTTADTGFGAVVQAALDDLTDEFDGVLSRKSDLLTNQQDLLNDRIGNLNVLLDAKRTRLQNQFLAMERALASLQAQQGALAPLTQLAGGFSL